MITFCFSLSHDRKNKSMLSHSSFIYSIIIGKKLLHALVLKCFQLIRDTK